VSRYQKDKTNLDLTQARDSEWQWHQLGHMQACTSLQTDNHTSTPPFSFFTGRMHFLLPDQQHQSTEGTIITLKCESDQQVPGGVPASSYLTSVWLCRSQTVMLPSLQQLKHTLESGLIASA